MEGRENNSRKKSGRSLTGKSSLCMWLIALEVSTSKPRWERRARGVTADAGIEGGRGCGVREEGGGAEW